MLGFSKFLPATILGLLAATLVSAAPAGELVERASTDKLVFAHFMMGIVGDRNSAADYDADMIRAKSYNIDAFALNIGTDSNVDEQLGYAYQSATNNGMKVFISFDFNWYSTSSAATVGAMIGKYGVLSGQLLIDGKAFASSFIGDGLDVAAMRSAAGIEVFFVPNFSPGTDFSNLDGAFNWIAWNNNGNNKAPDASATVTVSDGDVRFKAALGTKPYMAPVSPWFNTHYGAEVSYSKNWVFPSDLLWYNRWNEILSLGSRFVEIITWNDYGESHYVGPLSSMHYDDGGSKWVNDMPHNGWLEMAAPFINAFKAGSTSVADYITEDKLVYWYRPNQKSLNCDATDTTMEAANNASGNYFNGKPSGWNSMADSVFVVALLKEAGVVTVSSGGNTQSFNAPAGASSYQVDMGLGQQQFSLTRDGASVLSGVSLKDITAECICGIYNFNAFVGTVAPGASDPLAADGLTSLLAGLKVSTCSARPSLATDPAAPTTAVATTTLVSNPTTTAPATPAATTTSASGACILGTGPGNYEGLCNFSCHYNYCPDVCTCTGYGTVVTAPANTGVNCVPATGLDVSYSGLCSFACDHGYVPSGACTVV